MSFALPAYHLIVIVALTALLVSHPGPGAQDPRRSAEIVALPVSVTAADGGPVTDLGAGDFQILESGSPIEVERLEVPGAPVNLAIVFDSSPTADSAIASTRDTLRSLVGMVDRAFPIALVEAQAEVRSVQELTTDRGALVEAIDSLEAARGPSNHIIDATVDALVALLEAGTPRAAVAVITDGIDVGSGGTIEQMERAIHLAGIPVYVVAVDNAEGYRGNARSQVSGLGASNPLRGAIADLADQLERIYYQRRDQWRQLAAGSGGGFFDASGDMEPAFRELADRLNSTYTHYYDSPVSSEASDSVPIEVRVDRPGVEVHAPAAIWRAD